MKRRSYLLILTVLSLFLGSCRNVKEFAYFQPSDTVSAVQGKVFYPNFPQSEAAKPSIQQYDAIIQPNDILAIYITSLSPEATSFFNTITPSSGPSADLYSTKPEIGYVVDDDGTIEFPLIGKLKLGGLTMKGAHDTLVSRLEKYLQSPTVRVYLANYKITVLGDVLRPGVYTNNNDRITLPQALGLAGDLTIFGNRQEVLLIREENGSKQYINIDLTKRDLFSSPYYYLHSNDIIYVPPVKGKVATTDNFYRTFPIIMSSITLIALIVTNLLR